MPPVPPCGACPPNTGRTERVATGFPARRREQSARLRRSIARRRSAPASQRRDAGRRDRRPAGRAAGSIRRDPAPAFRVPRPGGRRRSRSGRHQPRRARRSAGSRKRAGCRGSRHQAIPGDSRCAADAQVQPGVVGRDGADRKRCCFSDPAARRAAASLGPPKMSSRRRGIAPPGCGRGEIGMQHQRRRPFSNTPRLPRSR